MSYQVWVRSPDDSVQWVGMIDLVEQAEYATKFPNEFEADKVVRSFQNQGIEAGRLRTVETVEDMGRPRTAADIAKVGSAWAGMPAPDRRSIAERNVEREKAEQRVDLAIEAFARFRHEATGPDKHNGRNIRPEGAARGASPIGLATWDEVPESWREQYRQLCRKEAGL